MAKSKSLVIVESPSKGRTISKFLGKDFVVESSYGHIRDLPKSKLGVDVEHDFEPSYVIPTKAKKRVTELKKLAKNADKIILATDEDREGEAIAWHLTQALGLENSNSKNQNPKVERIVFHEITKEAIDEALAHPRKIDQHLVDAQQARRVLDRLVGYNLSPLLWKKIRYGLSAGRVQSAALRLIVEREREIEAFNPQEYWSIQALLEKADSPPAGGFKARLNKVDGKTLDKLAIKNETEAKEITDALNNASWQVEKIETKDVKRNPTAPFITSTLQQEANRKLGFSGKQTMMIAQQLYEGFEVGEHGTTGLITYMRTDSTNLSNQALTQAKQVINDLFGKDYVLDSPRIFKKKSKGAQEAHEAIRPTSLARKPEDIKEHLDPKQFKLYELIWKRTLASQMPEAKFKATTVDIATGTKYGFRATGQVLVFDGFLKVYAEGTDEEGLSSEALAEEGLLPELSEKEKLKLQELSPNQHFTQPPPRFTDASLIKALEEFGIGRPSTYAPTISTIIERQYVERDQKRLMPTDIGKLVTGFLSEHFANIVDYQFTARMEGDLDEIAEGKRQWQPIISAFFKPFAKEVAEKQETLEKITEPIDNKCPECGGPMVAKFGRFGKFGACLKYPECKGTLALDEAEKELEAHAKEVQCPECGSEMVVKRGRFGPFLGCSKYPECKGIAKIEKKFGPCPDCGEGEVVERHGGRGKRIFYGCSRYPDCKYITNKKPDSEREGN